MRYYTLGLALMMGLMSVSGVQAQRQAPKWYAGVQGAVTFVEEAETEISNRPVVDEMDFDKGYGVGVNLGYAPGGTGTILDKLRFELEYYYRKNDISGVDVLPASGEVSSKTAMINAYYDIPLKGYQIVPYLGAGIGIAETEIEADSILLRVQDEDTVFAWNAMAGIGYTPDYMPSTVWSIGYRYFATDEPRYRSQSVPLFFPAGDVKHEYGMHTVEAGVRYMF